MVSNLNYAQYPIVKKIGNDSVILITLKQGNDINKKFDENKLLMEKMSDTISTLKMGVKEFKSLSDSLAFKNIRTQSVSDSFRYMYEQNKIIYLDREKFWDKNFKREQRLFAINGTALVLLCMLLAWL
jgi:hypothetical protein